MYEFLRLLNVLDLVLQYLTNWMSYVAIVLAVVLAVFQIAYFVLDKKHSNM